MPSVLQDKPLQAVMNFMNQLNTGSVGITHIHFSQHSTNICEIRVITVTILQNLLKLMHSAGVQIESLFTEK